MYVEPAFFPLTVPLVTVAILVFEDLQTILPDTALLKVRRVLDPAFMVTDDLFNLQLFVAASTV